MKIRSKFQIKSAFIAGSLFPPKGGTSKSWRSGPGAQTRGFSMVFVLLLISL